MEAAAFIRQQAQAAQQEADRIEYNPSAGNSFGQNLREGIGRFGVSYRGAVPWGEKAPAASLLTVAARYVPPRGSPVISAPITFPRVP